MSARSTSTTDPAVASPAGRAGAVPNSTAPALEARGITLAYERTVVFEGLDLRIERGEVTTLVGANGSGKSTLLKAFGRLLVPSAGTVHLEGRPVRSLSTRDVARRLAILPQKPLTPSATTVRDLVSRGRHPHQSLLRPWTGNDSAVVDTAIEATGLVGLESRDAGSLSGGQLQRAWIALILAQEAPTILLDEPTTFLDLAHQLDVLRLVRRINRERGATVLMVLHDLSLAGRYSDRLVVVGGGRVIADGTPWEVLTPGLLREAFDLDAMVIPDPSSGSPLIVPVDPDLQHEKDNLTSVNLFPALRRSGLLLVPVLALAGLAGCAGAASPAADAGAGAGASTSAASAAWSYTDDTGKTVNLDHRPERVASYADYALGLLSYGIDPVAVFGRQDVKTDARFASYDLSKTAIVGNSYGEIDLEALAAAAPDIIVTGIYPTDRTGALDLAGPLYAFADAEQQAQIEKIAPIVAITIGGRGIDVIASSNKLAEALGASADTVAAAKVKYDAAAADLSAAAKESDLEVTQMYADADGIYVAKPSDEPEMELYRSLGVKFTDKNPDGYYYWDIYSWENAGQVTSGDVLLVNVEGYQRADLLAQATFASDAALQAGQFHSWNGAALDYASQAAHMTELAGILRSSKRL